MSTTYKANYSNNFYRVLYIFLLVSGVALRLYQHFLFNRPLHEDEAHLALNFIDSGYLGMFMPLKHFQSAPILFLLSVETFTNIFGYGAVALRSFPFVISLLSFPLFYFFVKDMTNNRLTAVLAFTMLAFSPYVIYYSSEVKPYILELSAFIYLGFILFSKLEYIAARRLRLLTYAGIVSLFLANLSMVMLGCIVVYRIYYLSSIKKHEGVNTSNYLLGKRANKKLFVAWGIAFVANVILNIIINPYADNMREVWKDAFIPFNIFSTDFTSFVSAKTGELMFSSLFLFESTAIAYVFWSVISVSAIAYMVYHKKYGWLAFTVLPLLAHALLSWVQLYPFYHRFLLYLMPSLMILFAVGINAIVVFVGKYITYNLAYLASAVLVVLILKGPMKQFPYGDKNIFPCLNYINSFPDTTKLYTTSTKTLYEYYYRVGYVHNATREEALWFDTPQRYYDSTSDRVMPYLLLHSRWGWDGFASVITDMKEKELILDSLTYSDYRVYYIKPYHSESNAMMPEYN